MRLGGQHGRRPLPNQCRPCEPSNGDIDLTTRLSVRNGVEQFSKVFSAQPVSGAAPPIGGARLSRIADAPDANESAQFTWSFVLSERPPISPSIGTVNVPFRIKTLSSNSSFSTSGKAVP